ncbi:selenoneine biosynthesis selenosugar synthase SenB [Tepidicella baoligensis]|uniref:selenoneine biosynthesis selenosugar synthase SenB n=1 Tax=Tepidicella baoligensis TaxID=2707016 RepID=UPI0015D9D334|nr:selenoneine biosynthesis selenosugar synthase SenB [Tepidicella baoligensis]
MAFQAPPPSVCIVTPALADANNGNWQTARRWARMLGSVYRVRLVREWPDNERLASQDGLMLALHARRSAASVAAWAQKHPDRPLVLTLTGTDLYRDIAHDPQAQHSLAVADRLVVLQEAGADQLPPGLRDRCRVVFQSSTTRQALPKTSRHLRVVVVGHLREEKSPQTVFDIARRLRPQDGIRIDHLGHALDPALGEEAQATARACPHYRWLGGVPHTQARERIQRAHVLLHPSRMEGGAHVIMEAVTSGTAVLASNVPGNVGMLGCDYAGFFPWGDVTAACTLLRQCRDSLGEHIPPQPSLLRHLLAQCRSRAPLFAPAAEARALQSVLAEALCWKPVAV